MSDYSYTGRRLLSRARLLDFLTGLDKSPADTAWSVYLPAGMSRAEVDGELSKLPDIPAELIELAGDSKTGIVLFWSPGQIYLVLPPFSLVEMSAASGYCPEPLDSLLRRDHRIALILVRLGAYAVGMCEGENLVSSKVGTGLVHGRHKKGGSSQARFRRHREKQMEYFFSRICQQAKEQLKPHLQVLDYMVYGGAWTTIRSLKKDCSFLQQFDDRLLLPLLDIPEPRESVLESAISRVWSSSLLEWRRD